MDRSEYEAEVPIQWTFRLISMLPIKFIIIHTITFCREYWILWKGISNIFGKTVWSFFLAMIVLIRDNLWNKGFYGKKKTFLFLLFGLVYLVHHEIGALLPCKNNCCLVAKFDVLIASFFFSKLPTKTLRVFQKTTKNSFNFFTCYFQLKIL